MTPTDEPLDFQSVHDRYRSRVLGYLTRLVGPAEAEDLTQAVMLKVSEALPGFRGESSVSTWIIRIATNAAMDRLRRKSPVVAVEASDGVDEGEGPPEPGTASVEAEAIRGEMSACIREFIERLPDNYRSVLQLAELQGLGNEEIAGRLGLTVGTVKIRLHRARARLRKDLEAGCNFDRDGEEGLACERKSVVTVPFPRRR